VKHSGSAVLQSTYALYGPAILTLRRPQGHKEFRVKLLKDIRDGNILINDCEKHCKAYQLHTKIAQHICIQLNCVSLPKLRERHPAFTDEWISSWLVGWDAAKYKKAGDHSVPSHLSHTTGSKLITAAGTFCAES